MTPQEHYDEAARLLDVMDDGTGNEWCQWRAQVAQVHATLALAGFTRDGALEHVHDVFVSPAEKVNLPGGPAMRTTGVTTETGRPA